MKKHNLSLRILSISLASALFCTQLSIPGFASVNRSNTGMVTQSSLDNVQSESVLDSIQFTLADGSDVNLNTVKENFSVTTTINGTAVAWSSSNTKIVDILEGNATIKQPKSGYSNVTLTATANGKTKLFALRILSKDYYGFENAYAKVGEKLKTCGYPEGSTYNWKVYEIGKSAGGNPERDNVDPIFKNATRPIKEKTNLAKTETTGEFEITKDMLECFIQLQVDGKIPVTIYCSELPVMYIDGSTNYYDITKEQTSDVTIQMQGNPLYSTGLYTGASEIKLRGNSTKDRPKRPFKLKLDKKTDLLGLGTEDDGTSYASKHWVLLANDIDHSLLRNKLLYDFSGAIGTEFYFHSTNVIVIYNGEYEGVYQLCEHRRVDEGRIEILKDANDKNSYTDWEGVAENIAEAIAKNDIDKANATARAEFAAALEKKMLSDFSWIDSGKVQLNGATYGIVDAASGENTVTIQTKTYNFSDYKLTLPDTDGGYLIEMDFYSMNNPTIASMETAFGQPLYFSSPEPDANASVIQSFTNTSLYQQAQKLSQSFEYALHSDDFYFRNSDKKYKVTQIGEYDWCTQKYQGTQYSAASYTDEENNNRHYSQMFDMDSLVTNFIFCEYAMNWDSMKNSFFYYKKSGEVAKIGPQWDFDWCWGNQNMYDIDTWAPETWQTTNEWFAHEQYYQTQQWNRMLIRDPYFLIKAYEKYKEARPIMEDMIKEGGLIDTYAAQNANAGKVNDLRWGFTYTNYFYGGQQNKEVYGYDKSIAQIKLFLATRIQWLDKQFTSIDSLMKSLNCYKRSNKLGVSNISTNGKNTTITATVRTDDIKQVAFQINGTTLKTALVSNGSASVSVDNTILDSNGHLNCVEIKGKDASGKYLYASKLSSNQSYNMTVSNYAAFTTDGKTNTIASVKMAKSEYKLSVGQTTDIATTFTPASEKSNLSWTSSNRDVATVFAGKVTAVAPGTTTVTCYTANGSMAMCTVVVSCKNPTGLKPVSATGKLSMTWNVSDSATDYVIYRSSAKNGTYTKLATTKTNTYTDKTAAAGKTYYYKVTAYAKTANTSSGSSNILTMQLLKKTTSFKAKASGKQKVKLTWKKVSGANGYEIYRSTKKKSGFKKIATLKKGSIKKYLDKKGVQSKKVYYYKIKAYKKINGVTVYSDLTVSKKVRAK